MEVPGKSLRDKIDEDIDTIVPFVLARKNSKGLVAALPLRYAKAPLKGIGSLFNFK